VIINCLATAEFHSLDDQLKIFADSNYVELTQQSSYRYDDPDFIFALTTDITENSFPQDTLPWKLEISISRST
jgi:hypothetical protein